MPQPQQRFSLACLSLVSSGACCRLFAVLSLLVCPAVVADDADPSLYVFRFIEVSPQNVAAWRDAVAAKQQQFADAPDAARWGTWKIVTGPRSGQFSRGFATTQSGLTNPATHRKDSPRIGTTRKSSIGWRTSRRSKSRRATHRSGGRSKGSLRATVRPLPQHVSPHIAAGG